MRSTGSWNTASTDCASTRSTRSAKRTGSTRWPRRSAPPSRPGRHVHLVLENDANVASHLRGDFDAQWNDDAHHVLHVLLTGENEGYYGDYADDPAAKLARSLAEGFVYQGEPSPHRDGEPRGTPSADLAADRLRALSAKPRSDRQPRLRRAADRAEPMPARSKRRSRCRCSLRRSRCIFMGEERRKP